MYIPFVLVILGIGACSFVYQDELLGRFNQSEETTVIEPEIVTEVPVEEITPIDQQPESEIVDEGTEPSFDDRLPPIGECFCPDK